ncbi:4-alpha-glucanotransferase [Bifidobacterium aesculapii]|uniref:4-alpha-glucanotransferase n=1 Tax=Bifidobacterium aesculapii TaxID=1329411 RepID=UPI0006E342FB|nr:4-alpha-glucanotransferase [Bifidobacterium aesculapii]
MHNPQPNHRGFGTAADPADDPTAGVAHNATDGTGTPGTGTAHAEPPASESPERLTRPLIRLAKASGVATSYIDQLGTYVEIADDVLVDVLAALGVDASSSEAIGRELDAIAAREAAQVLPSKTIVVTVEETGGAGTDNANTNDVDTNTDGTDIADGSARTIPCMPAQATDEATAPKPRTPDRATACASARRLTPSVIRLHCPDGFPDGFPEGAEPSVTITLEDGSVLHGDAADLMPDFNSADLLLTLPAELPIGYHTLRVDLPACPSSAPASNTNRGPKRVGGDDGESTADEHAAGDCARKATNATNAAQATTTNTAWAATEHMAETATLIVAPKRIPLPEALAQHPRWGWMTQLYSVRSAESWGVGDYGDLRRLAADAAERSGADFMLINPAHAGAPVPPLEPSPYLPQSRRFLNVTYIRPQDIPEYAHAADGASDDSSAAGDVTPANSPSPANSSAPAGTSHNSLRARVRELHALVSPRNGDPDPLNLNASWQAKREALRLIFESPRSPEREAAFEAFKRQSGSDLDAFAAWCVAFEVWGAPWETDSWFLHTNRDSPEVKALVEEHHDLFEFNRWLQWIADEQLTAAQRAAKRAGMAVGLMLDMAVGVHALGVDAWWNPERFAGRGVTVGCPPDFYNQQGQDWGQPPFHPQYLEETGYRVYRDMVHAMFAHAGAVRIDHILGLFRLWWIPRGKGARGGAYVAYDHEAMLAVLAVEATRAHGVVVGEDLGTVPDYVRTILAEHGVFGTDVEWFSRVDDSPNAGDPYKPPTEYRRQALASVTTHDLPPTAGYLEFEHVRLHERLHLLDGPVEEFAASAWAERRAMLDRLVEGGWLAAATADAAQRDMPLHEQEVVEAMHAMLTATPSLLLQAALVDGTGQHASVNQPGTSDQYPNWRIPLTDGEGRVVTTDEVFSTPRVLSLAAVMNRQG